MESMGGFRSDLELRGGGGGGLGLNRWLRVAEELSPINIHKYRWLVVVAQKIWKN